jgi:pyruvate kinase
VIINYCAALHFVTTTSATDDPYPVLLNLTDNASALINDADLAMYRAKASLTQDICFYEADMDQAVRARRRVTQALREALDLNLVTKGDRVLVTAGVPFDVPGTTNLLKVETV